MVEKCDYYSDDEVVGLKGGNSMNWIKKSNNNYLKTIGKSGALSCIKYCKFGNTWWEINYSDEYIDKYIEVDEDEINPECVDKVLKYADEWLFELIDNIKTKYNKLEVNNIK